VRRISGNTHGLGVGTHVRIDIWVYASPAVFHESYRTVNVPDPLGAMPAWYVPGTRHTWVILVHGYGTGRREGLRPLPVLHGLGLPVLDMTYRNDVGAPPSPDHLYHLGATEWVDVQAGVRYALAHGAHDVILYGYSMGGGIVVDFLRHSPYVGRARGVVLDSPALDWNAVLDLQASQRSLPGILTEVAKRVVAYRLGLSSLDSLDAVRASHVLRTPTLLFLGTADTTVPIGPSVALARARPDIVTLVRVVGAEHTQSWNADPAAYMSRLRAFLVRTLR
jgi:pimeloyl-ACP methyl ester carboxylesterase